MKWIFLSPHLDDVIYSCGGFIWDLTESSASVEIWTLFAGDPPASGLSNFADQMHQSWGLTENPVQARREEDQKACNLLNAIPRYFNYLDCIYRRSPEGVYLYESDQALFAGMDPSEVGLVDEISARLAEEIPQEVRLVGPLGIGNHVDHEITRKAVNRMQRSSLFYADYPYAREEEGIQILEFLSGSIDWRSNSFSVSEMGLEKWYQASKAYSSQLSIFWSNEGALRKEIRDFSDFLGGMTLWESVEEE